jgi:hypothetical protein
VTKKIKSYEELTDDFEMLIRPYDAQWEVIITKYGFCGDDDIVFRAVGSRIESTVQEAINLIR